MDCLADGQLQDLARLKRPRLPFSHATIVPSGYHNLPTG